MTRVGRAARAAMLAVVVAAAAACGQGGGEPTTTASTSSAGPLVSPVVGVPIDIDAEGFSKVKAFTIRMGDGQERTFAMGVLENGAEFPPNHLAEHLAGSTPVRVFFRDEGGRPVVYRLEDAEPAP